MQVFGPAHVHGAQPLNAPHTSRVSETPAPSGANPIQDELSISDAARAVDQVGQVPDMRMDRVQQIRAQIADGTYETPQKLDIALGRLLDEIG
jgi:negative regulator of flagellin synthesis FlgM